MRLRIYYKDRPVALLDRIKEISDDGAYLHIEYKDANKKDDDIRQGDIVNVIVDWNGNA